MFNLPLPATSISSAGPLNPWHRKAMSHPASAKRPTSVPTPGHPVKPGPRTPVPTARPSTLLRLRAINFPPVTAHATVRPPYVIHNGPLHLQVTSSRSVWARVLIGTQVFQVFIRKGTHDFQIFGANRARYLFPRGFRGKILLIPDGGAPNWVNPPIVIR